MEDVCFAGHRDASVVPQSNGPNRFAREYSGHELLGGRYRTETETIVKGCKKEGK
jgi:hypothetical protein